MESNTLKIMRSFLQKAVRRGDINLTEKIVIYLLNNDDIDWLRKRLAAITFEESWAYGSEISYEKEAQVIINHYKNLSSTVKNKNASGLGLLAYSYFNGDKSVFNMVDKEHFKYIKFVGEALKRPNDFWNWAINETKSNPTKSVFINNAFDSSKKASWLWDKAFVIAAAYLAIADDLPKIQYSKINNKAPYWVGIDKHTQAGKQAILKVADENRINPDIALSLSFYFEGAVCNETEDSLWWDKTVLWEMKKLNLEIEQGQKIWNQMKDKVEKLLEPESLKIHNELKDIKLSEKFNLSEQMKLF